MSDIQRVLLVDANGAPIYVAASGTPTVPSFVHGSNGLINSGESSSDGVVASQELLYTRTNNLRYNGTTWDRERNNFEATALTAAARTVTTTTGNLLNYNHKGIIIFVDVTAISATPVLTPTILLVDPVSGGLLDFFVAASTLTATGRATYIIYPSTLTARDGIDEVANLALPRTFRVRMTHADSDSATYSVGYALIL